MMKRGAILVNTSRGAVVDRRRSSRRCAPAVWQRPALDVYEDEPQVPAELRAAPNTVLLPHVGSATGPTRDAMARLCAENVIAVDRRARAARGGGLMSAMTRPPADHAARQRRRVQRAVPRPEDLGPLGRRRPARRASPPDPGARRRGRAARARRHQRHAEPAAGHRGRRPTIPSPADHPHDDARRHRHRLGIAALHQGLRRRRLPQRRPHAHRRAVPRGLRGLALQRPAGRTR